MERGALRAVVRGVTQSQTRLKGLSKHTQAKSYDKKESV